MNEKLLSDDSKIGIHIEDDYITITDMEREWGPMDGHESKHVIVYDDGCVQMSYEFLRRLRRAMYKTPKLRTWMRKR